MLSETRQCQNCKEQFTIEPEDFEFYKKIEVPPPTWCPNCRMMRKLVIWNERALFRGKCQAPGHNEEFITRYSPESGIPVYDHEYWWSDKWDPMDYGKEYDFSRPFFEQLGELLRAVPRANVNLTNSVNCDYCTSVINCKNCYLVAGGYLSQDCMYCDVPAMSRNCVDSSGSFFCENLYESFSSTRSFNVLFGTYCIECMDSRFMYDCRNCSNCFGCVGLRNKKYHIFNKPHSKKEYEAAMAKIDLGSYKTLQEMHTKHNKLVMQFPRPFMISKNVVNCTGNNIENAKNCRHCFEVREGTEDSKYVLIAGVRLKDSYDVYGAGAKAELLYEASALGSHRVFFSDSIKESFDIQHSFLCTSSEHLFGCVGLRNKRYCILNKQYTEEEYRKLVSKIIKHINEMPYISKSGAVYRYGEFSPPEFSADAYNDTMAHEYFPLTKEKAEKQGLRWRDVEQKDYDNALEPEQLPDHIKNVKDDILEQVIVCSYRGRCLHQCKGVFKIISKELAFYRRFNLPLPRLCSDCRHHERVQKKRLYGLWHRQCQCAGIKSENSTYKNSTEHFHKGGRCPNEFETPYTPEQEDTVYCEQCYQTEVV